MTPTQAAHPEERIPPGRGGGHRRDLEDQRRDPRQGSPPRSPRAAPQAPRLRPGRVHRRAERARGPASSASSASPGPTRPGSASRTGLRTTTAAATSTAWPSSSWTSTGPKVLDDERDERTQDFVLMDHPVFFSRNARSNRALAEVMERSSGPSLLEDADVLGPHRAPAVARRTSP